MPVGQPRQGDRGLDHMPHLGPHLLGRCVVLPAADVRMRQRGTPTRGLQHALQGVLAAGGDYRVAWHAQRILAAADAALGQNT